MKKIFNKTYGWLAFAILLGVVLGCNFSSDSSGGTNGKNDNTDKQTKKSDEKKSSDKDEKTAKSGLADNIVGTWEGNPGGREKITMTFEKNGSLVVETDDDEEKNSEKTTYKVIDEKTVEVKFSDGKTSKLTDIKISGDTMQAKGKNSEPATFKRVSGKTNDSENPSDDDG